ncbi:hypothetical protein MNB_SV-13-129 [hydrothermal vent metagenome]|uniref:Uncharacterized protein n=1 Tax=hydrothermal vent metagenome TaxID=652676 RepID=A0A1W1CYN9_9ZZZZ
MNEDYANNIYGANVKPETWTFGTAFDKGNVGTTLGGIGQGIGLVAGIYGANEDRKMRNKLYDMEKKRIARNEAKEDKFHADMTKAWS